MIKSNQDPVTDTTGVDREYMKFGVDARDKLVSGAKKMYDAVCSTLSPKGRNVAIARSWGAPIVVHDGVTVAREVKSNDRFEQIGIDLIREASQKTNEEAGDGTTTSTLIAYEIIKRGMDLLKDNVNPMILRNEINTAMKEALEELQNISKKAETKEDLQHVAQISSANEEIGTLVGETVFKVGVDGLVSVEESGAYETVVEHSEGMLLDKGYSSQYFVTNVNRMEAIVDDATVIITDRDVTTNAEIVSLVEYVVGTGTKNIVIIGSVGGQALSTLIKNKVNGVINCVVVKRPGYGEFSQGLLEDIAVLTGGRVLSKELGMTTDEMVLNDFVDTYLGKAEKVIVGRNDALIVKGGGTQKEVDVQIKRLKGLMSKAPSKPEKEQYEERIAKLSSGVSVIRVGAKTEVEGREKVERVKDAVGAAQSALKEGIVPGSGVTFLKIAKAIIGDSDGARLMREVLECPVRKVMSNSGEPDKIIKDYLSKIKDKDEVDYGYESVSGELKNMYEVGVIDPTKVVRLCLENGVSVASMILTTDTIIDFIDPITGQ